MGSGYSFIKQMGGVLREEGRQMMDILIPRECLVCGKKLHKSEKYLCIYCESDLPLTYYWERRNNPMSSKLNGIIQKNLTDNCLENENIPKVKFLTLLLFSSITVKPDTRGFPSISNTWEISGKAHIIPECWATS